MFTKGVKKGNNPLTGRTNGSVPTNNIYNTIQLVQKHQVMNLKIHTSGDATTDVGWINKQRMAGNWGKSMNWEQTMIYCVIWLLTCCSGRQTLKL